MAARQWLPGIENIFTSLEGNLRRAVQSSVNCDIESAQYWLARLENIEEILNLFLCEGLRSLPKPTSSS